MKRIRITADIPVAEGNRPKIGSTYEINSEEEYRGRKLSRKIYFITVNGIEVGVYDNECEVVDG